MHQYRTSPTWRRSGYSTSWIIKLVVLLLPTLGYGIVLLCLLSAGSWRMIPFFMLPFLIGVLAAALVIIRRTRPRLCYQNRNCIFCPFSCKGIEGQARQVSVDMPETYQWGEWLDRSRRYIDPIMQALGRHTSSTFTLMSSGGGGERCAVPFDIQDSKCVGLKLCYSSHDVSPLRSDHDAMLIPDTYAGEYGTENAQYPHQLGVITGNGIPDGFAQLVLNTQTGVLNKWAPYCFQQNGYYYLATNSVRDLTMTAVRSVRIGTYPGSRSAANCDCSLLEYVGGRIVTVEEAGPAVKLNIEDDQIPWWSLLLSICCCLAACPLCCAMSDSARRVYFEADLIISMWCPVWPSCANEWTSRPRHWPPPDVVSDIVTSGCHLVPKPSRPDVSSRLEWRWSFSLGEVKLAFAYPQRARTCYMLLKIMRSSYLKYKCPFLKTYHLKTILLWTIERNPVEIWTANGVEACIDLLLEEMIECVEARNCPNFWLPRVNLFAELQEPDARKLARRLTNIRANPDVYFANCGSLLCGHYMLNIFNVLVMGPLFIFVFTFMIILLADLSEPAKDYDYYNASFPWNMTTAQNYTMH